MSFHAAQWINQKVKAMKRYDIAFLKVDVLIFGFLIAKFFPVLTSFHRGWYVAIILLFEIYFIQRIFGGESSTKKEKINLTKEEIVKVKKKGKKKKK